MKRRFFLTALLSGAVTWVAALLGGRRADSATRASTAPNTASAPHSSPVHVPPRGGCVLCGRTREQVKKLILGVHGGVCPDCVELCNDILRSDAHQNGKDVG